MRRTANSGAFTESVFYILLRLHNSAHGYALMKYIAQMTDDRVTIVAGSLYGALNTLQKRPDKSAGIKPTTPKNRMFYNTNGQRIF